MARVKGTAPNYGGVQRKAEIISNKYFATISWDELVENGVKKAEAAEVTIHRDKLSWLVEDVAEYLDKYKARGSYLDLASFEMELRNGTSTRNITKDVLNNIKGSK